MQISSRAFIIVLVLIASSPQATKPSSSPESKATVLLDSFAGCYEVKTGRWWPWGFGTDATFVTPPKQLRLLADRGTHGFEHGELLIRDIPALEPPPGSRASSFWRIESQSRIRLIWTNGFSGVALSLEKHGNELSGWAHPHFDFPTLVPRTAHVTAHRMTCPAK